MHWFQQIYFSSQFTILNENTIYVEEGSIDAMIKLHKQRTNDLPLSKN